jgi:hypothetical protein
MPHWFVHKKLVLLKDPTGVNYLFFQYCNIDVQVSSIDKRWSSEMLAASKF